MKKFTIFHEREYRVLIKMLQILQITFFILFTSVLQTSANGTYSQKTEFNPEVDYQKVSVVLDEILTESDMVFTKTDQNINLAASSLSEPVMQARTISGTVTDESGNPMVGVTVVIKGTTSGTITDIDGNYSLANVPVNAVLQFSFIGMKSQEIEVGSNTSIDVSLEVDTIGLEEVVAIGYGSMKKIDVTGAVSSVKGEDINEVKSFYIADALQGKLSGVSVTQTGDVSSEPKIRIRGLNTIGGNNDPTIIIDNPTSGLTLNDINPSDIVSIDVLKDASSSAIFGINASNGVILVTTKRAKYGPKYTNVELNASYGISYLPRRYDLLNASELVDVIDLARANQNDMGGSYLLYDEIWDNDFGRQDVTDWQDEFYRNGHQQDYNLAVRGGSESAIYGLSLAYQNIQGIAPGNEAYRYTARLNFETKAINDLVNIGSNLNFSTRDSKGIVGLNGFTGRMFRSALTPPHMPTHDEEGNPYIETDALVTEYFNGFKPSEMYNYVAIFNDQSNPRNNFSMELYGNVDIIKGLTAETRFGYRIGNNYYRNFNSNIGNPMSAASSLNVASGQTRGYTWQNTLRFDKTFGANQIDAVAGFTLEESTLNSVSAQRSTFPPSEADALKYLGFGDAASATNDEIFNNHRTNSYFIRGNYNYRGKYLLTATVRRDGDAYFHPDVRWGTFPSASLGWKISEENFMQDIKWLDLLKVRFGIGKVGRALDDFAYLSEVASGELTPIGQGNTDYYFGGVRNTGKVVTLKGNTNLTWETTRMLNLGIDFGIMNFAGSVEYFDNTTYDILLKGQIPDIAGISYGLVSQAPYINAGEVKTHGIDFNLNYMKSIGDFYFSIGINGAYSANEVTNLYQQEYIGEDAVLSFLGGVKPMNRTYVGEPIGSYYGYRWDGIFNSAGEVAAANQIARDIAKQNDPGLSDADLNGIYYISANTAPGDFKFKDLNGDGQITDDDREYLGTGNPPFSYGINLSADYKGFDFGMNLVGVAGNKIHALIEPVFLNPSSFNCSKDILNYWTPDNQNTDVPRLSMNDPNFNYRASDRWLYGGAYLRCQNIILGYTLPQKITGKIIRNIRIYSNIKNLFTITKYPFLDPEVSGSLTGAPDVDMGAGVDIGSMPFPRTFMLGVNVKF